MICRRYEGHSYPSESVPDLPEFRVKGDFAFSFTGIDFASPLFVKNRKSNMRKVYICLFTCATSRAIHLELVNDLTADTFLCCFCRFVSRRGIPSLIVTDNAKTFKNAAKRLVALFELQEVVEFMNDKGIKWDFNLPKAPWWGGFFERLVKCTKRCIKKILGNPRLSFDEMHTVLTEIEAILNSRPLTYIDVEDIDEALTPSHLMHGKRLLTLPDADLTLEEEDDRHVLTRREAYLIRTLCHYWRRWKGEYLLELREYHNLSVKKKNLPSIQEGDIVIIHEGGRVPRSQWKLGKVEKLIEGNDGKVRSAEMRIAHKGKKSTFLKRPVQRLYPLEVRSLKQCKTLPDDTKDNENTVSKIDCPRRTAVVVADLKRQMIDQCLSD